MKSSKKLRKYQEEAVEAIRKVNIGQVILPTGSGKTEVALEAIIKNLIEEKLTHSVNVVFTPRLGLNLQWQNNLLKKLNQFSQPVIIINVSSDEIDPTIKEEINKHNHRLLGYNGIISYLETLSKDDVNKKITEAKNNNYHVFVISTYHSSHVIEDLICKHSVSDEAHSLVISSKDEADFRKSLNIKTEKKWFFTATPKITGAINGIGQDNETVFGLIVYGKSPKEIIDIGAILPGKLHIIGSTNCVSEGDYETIADLLIFAFNSHKENLYKVSIDSAKIAPKVLYSCDGLTQIEGILNSTNFNDWRIANPTVNCLAIFSPTENKRDTIYINGTWLEFNSTNKKKFFKTLFGLKHEESAFILHYDMIGLGIDVPTITAVMPLRNCNKITFCQLLGRATRLHPEDYDNIFSNETLKAKDYSNYIKPHCEIIIPYFMYGREDFLKIYSHILMELREQYGWDSSEIVYSNFKSPASSPQIFDELQLDKEIRSYSKSDIEEFFSQAENEYFDEEIWILTTQINALSLEEKVLFVNAYSLGNI